MSERKSAGWRLALAQIGLALALVGGLSFAAKVSGELSKAELRLHGEAVQEPQSADPLESFVEVFLPPAAMPMLSSGYMGIAPSLHLIRLSSSVPLSNIDPIENPARRRYGRVELSFAILFGLPLALLLFGVLISWRIRESGAYEKLRSGKSKLWDFGMEHVVLPLSAWLAFSFGILLSAMYGFGLRLENNEAIWRMTAWVGGTAAYAAFWLLLFLWLLLRERSLERCVLVYGLFYLGLNVIAPSLCAVVALAGAGPEARASLAIERRERNRFQSAIEMTKVEALARKVGVQDFVLPSNLARQQLLTNLALEEEAAPSVAAFTQRIERFEDWTNALRWLSPMGVTQALVDDLAGTGLRRYAAFRAQTEEFRNVWRKQMLPMLLRGQNMDYDGLKATPRFQFREEAASSLALRSGVALGYLALLCAVLGALILREWGRRAEQESGGEKQNATP